MRDAMAQGSWDLKAETSLRILDLCKALRQGGLDRGIPFRGRSDRHVSRDSVRDEPLNVIPVGHWQDFKIDPISLHRTEDDSSVRTYCLSEQSRRGYLDLHIDKKSALRWQI